jgi:hypothetical protein
LGRYWAEGIAQSGCLGIDRFPFHIGIFFCPIFFGKKFDAPKKNGEIGPPNAASPRLRRHNSRPAISF